MKKSDAIDVVEAILSMVEEMPEREWDELVGNNDEEKKKRELIDWHKDPVVRVAKCVAYHIYTNGGNSQAAFEKKFPAMWAEYCKHRFGTIPNLDTHIWITQERKYRIDLLQQRAYHATIYESEAPMIREELIPEWKMLIEWLKIKPRR